MTRYFTLFLMLCVCYAQNDVMEGSGEEELLTPNSNLFQASEDNYDDLDFFKQVKNDGCGVDLVFLMDASGSLEQIYTQHINWTIQLVEALLVNEDQVHIAVIQYAETPITEFSLDTYNNPRDIIVHIMTTEFQSGGTKTGEALKAAENELFSKEKGARQNATKIIVLYTDGLSSDDPLKRAQELREVKNVEIYVVSVGSDVSEHEMNRIAGQKSNVFGSNEYHRLQKVLISDVEDARNCHESEKWRAISEIPSVILEETEKTTITTTDMESRIPLNGEEIVNTSEHRVLTFATTRPILRKSVLKDKQLKLKSKKFPIKQAAIPQAQVARIETADNSNLENSQKIEETSTEVMNIDEQLVEDITALQQITVNELPKETSTTDAQLIVKPEKNVQSADTDLSTGDDTSWHLSTTVPNSRITETSKPTTTQRPSQPRTKRPQNQKSVLTTGSAIKGRGHCPREVLFIVDSSGSVQKIYDQQKEYLLSLLSELKIGEDEQRVALIQFAGSSHQRVEWMFDTYNNAQDITDALDRVRHFTGTTFIGRALEDSIAVLETRRKDVPTIVILLSDGFSQDDAKKPAEQIRRMSNVDFYAVSMTELSNFDYLAKLTDNPSKVYVGQRSKDMKQDLLELIHCKT